MKYKCIRDSENCIFYDNMCEFAIDGCMFGASMEDKEEEKWCFKHKRNKRQEFLWQIQNYLK